MAEKESEFFSKSLFWAMLLMQSTLLLYRDLAHSYVITVYNHLSFVGNWDKELSLISITVYSMFLSVLVSFSPPPYRRQAVIM